MGSPQKPSPELKALVAKIKAGVKITKVVCTRAVKGKGGESYVGFSAAWDTIQDDTGGGGELLSAHTGAEVQASHGQGLSLKEARIAALLVGMQVDIAAHDHAMAGGNITIEQRDMAVRNIKGNYSQLMAELLGGSVPINGEKA